jgi:type IV pilus assembly protein PilA
MNRLRERLAGQEGFTLIELLVVIVIIGILLAIAVPSYIGFTSKAQNATAEANIREALPSVEAYYSQNSSSYTGLTWTILQSTYDTGISPNVVIPPADVTATQLCLEATGSSGTTYYDLVPSGTITSTKPTGC